jgi:hypothetical protein
MLIREIPDTEFETRYGKSKQQASDEFYTNVEALTLEEFEALFGRTTETFVNEGVKVFVKIEGQRWLRRAERTEDSDPPPG